MIILIPRPGGMIWLGQSQGSEVCPLCPRACRQGANLGFLWPIGSVSYLCDLLSS